MIIQASRKLSNPSMYMQVEDSFLRTKLVNKQQTLWYMVAQTTARCGSDEGNQVQICSSAAATSRMVRISPPGQYCRPII